MVVPEHDERLRCRHPRAAAGAGAASAKAARPATNASAGASDPPARAGESRARDSAVGHPVNCDGP